MLRFLRKPLTHRNLWIDAICINQSDTKEKARQVGYMGLIYERADKVHIWLGPAAAEDQINHVFSILRNRALDLQVREYEDPNPTIEIFVGPVLSFLERPWFGRRWILQEVKLARAATAHCGEHRLPWNWVRDGMAGLQLDYLQMQNYHTSTKSISIAAIQALEAVASLHANDLIAEGTDILNLLWDHHSSECSDERDRIFALYGLMPRNQSAGRGKFLSLEPLRECPINYSLHFTEIYTQLATVAVKNGLGLLVLLHCFVFGVLADQDPDWPSWVPSWNMSRQFQTSIWSRHALSQFVEDPISVEQNDERPYIHAMGVKYPIVIIQKTRGEAYEPDKSVLQFFKTASRTGLHTSYERRGKEIMAGLLLNTLQTLEWHYDSEFRIQSLLPQKCGKIAGYPSWSEKNQIITLMEENEEKSLLRDSAGSHDDSTIVRDIDEALKDCTLLRYNLHGNEAPGIAFGNITSDDYIFRLADSETSASKSTIALVIQPQNLNNPGHHLFPGPYRIVGFCLDCYEWADLFRPSLRRFTKSVDPVEYVVIF